MGLCTGAFLARLLSCLYESRFVNFQQGLSTHANSRFPAKFASRLTCINSRPPRLCHSGRLGERPLLDVAREKILSLPDETRFAAQ
jgi:hypothetical protein